MNYKTKLDFTAEDLQELLNGEEFDWTYPATNEKGETIEIDIHLYNSEHEDS